MGTKRHRRRKELKNRCRLLQVAADYRGFAKGNVQRPTDAKLDRLLVSFFGRY